MPDHTVDFDWEKGDSPAALVDDLEALDDALDKYLVDALETWALLVEGTAKRLAPVQTGNLQGSIEGVVREVGENIIKAIIGTSVSYAAAVEYGRGPVVADEGYLRFVIDGEVYYRKRVAAAEAQPFMRPAIDSHLSDIRRLLKEAVRKAVKEVS